MKISKVPSKQRKLWMLFVNISTIWCIMNRRRTPHISLHNDWLSKGSNQQSSCDIFNNNEFTYMASVATLATIGMKSLRLNIAMSQIRPIWIFLNSCSRFCPSFSSMRGSQAKSLIIRRTLRAESDSNVQVIFAARKCVGDAYPQWQFELGHRSERTVINSARSGYNASALYAPPPFYPFVPLRWIFPLLWAAA